jgi:putative glycosyl hydrolase-like family 15 (GHL15) protein
MKRYFLLLQEQPLSKLLLIGIPLIILGGILIYVGYRVTQQAQPIPTPTIQPTQQVLLSTTPSHTATALPNRTIRLAWFYKPPEKGQLDLVAQNFDFFILTYKDENERDQLKAKGVTTPFSQYLLFLVINDPGDCQDNPIGNQVAFKKGDFCQISRDHPDWFLLDQNGDRIRGSGDNYYMDPGNEGFRQFWLERAREMQETYGWDNLFLDNVEASRAKMVEDDTIPVKYPDDKSYQDAVYGFLTYIRENYFQPQGKRMYGNIVSVDKDPVRERYIQQLDGVMIESFATDWSDGFREHDDWEQQLELAESVLSQGKTAILVSQGDENELDRQNFAFASYLLVADGNAVFRYANSDSYREVWLYDNYKLDLGTPLGKRYKSNDDWRRDFTNGSVAVDPKNHTAEIVVNQ